MSAPPTDEPPPQVPGAPGFPARLGLSGRVAGHFLDRRITPLLALAGLLLGLFALLITPREEDPQINVTFANVFVAFPGASSRQVDSLVSTPLEQVLDEISGVSHIYASSSPGLAVLTVRFRVGVARNTAIVRLYNAIYSHQNLWPANAGIAAPLIKPMGINDVPIVTLTLWTRDPSRGAFELGEVARSIEQQIKRVAGTRNVYTIGAPQSVVSVRIDPPRLAAHGLTIADLTRALQAANLVRQAGALVGADRVEPVQAGRFLDGRDDLARLVVGVDHGRAVFLRDVAEVSAGAAERDSYVWFGTGPAARAVGLAAMAHVPAVTIAVSKKPGTSAIAVAREVIARVNSLRGSYVPQGVGLTVTRNYGVTADAKVFTLIEKLLEATLSVVLLVVLTMGYREAIVVGAAVSVTLAVTLFASWAWGFTLNRVSLFALIFSIGILVDDAIVIVENVHRHLRLGGATLREIIPRAVDEVGGPTVLATFTVIAALLPMAFVRGLMGPYMSPIPINASSGMLISLAVALVFTPWMCRRLLHHFGAARRSAEGRAAARLETAPVAHRVMRLFERAVRPCLGGARGRARRRRLYWGLLVAILLACGLVFARLVVFKMLPFDNRSEFQVVANLPVGSTLESTARLLDELSQVIRRVPEVTDYQVYAGTAAPIGFNGLVRQYYLRRSPQLGDIQVNLVDPKQRQRQSHEIALAVRPALAAIARRFHASVQVVEVPPGPPVRAPIVAEIYGPSYAQQRRLALAVRRVFDATPNIVDTDDSVEAPATRLIGVVDRQRAALLGVSQAQIVQALHVALAGADVTYVHVGRERDPIPVRLQLPIADRADPQPLLALPLRARDGALVPMSELVRFRRVPWDGTIYRQDLMPVTYVTGDMAGPLDSPLYGMFEIAARLHAARIDGTALAQRLFSDPHSPNRFTLKWGGEWTITWQTFRDMGLAYAVGLVLIYLLIVAQFGSYVLPLIIMAPIPLTVIGVLPGHALLGAQFTATSMIGMIALAGIIVRNSILLVDFIDTEVRNGQTLEDAVVRAGAIRARPIAITALAAMIGALFILDDPIFRGLAVSLVFGVFVSTMLTLLVIPVIYYGYLDRRQARGAR